jgi:diguanylate cyclase (GGDEF)-like protein/PAS domain S-box-containing protein
MTPSAPSQRPEDVETAELRRQIKDLQSVLTAIRSGGIDAVLVGEPGSEELYTLASADRPYRLIVEQMGEGAATISVSGTVLFANERLTTLLGRSRTSVVGQQAGTLVPPAHRTALRELLTTAPGEVTRRELDLLHADGTSVPVLASVAGLDIEGAVVRCLVVADLTDRRRAEHQLAAAHAALLKRAAQLERSNALLARSSAQFTAAFERAPVGMALVGLDRTIQRANDALCDLTGYTSSQLVGMPLATLLEGSEAELELFAGLAAGRTNQYRCELRLVRADGAPTWASLSVARVHNDEGEDYVAFHIEDISDRKGYEGRLQYLADHDPLTGLLNRRRLNEELDHVLALDTRYEAGGALVLLDLDNFKYINDTLGHSTGDALLGVVTTAIRSQLRGSDLLARLGGDEFAMLLYAVDAAAATAIVTDLLRGVGEESLDCDGQRVRATASAGIALLDGSAGRTADEVLANADLAMYAAKEGGGNGLLVYDESGAAAALARAKLVWIDRVRQALEEDLFTLLAQPILDLARREVRGCELLLRMRDGAELVEPAHFLQVAERHGLAAAVDTHVVRKAIALAARFDRGPDFRWEVNISGASLADPSLPDVIAAEIRRHGVAPATLVFEITETAAITNMSEAQEFATRVTDLGCGFALDDFGAGYGGFYYLKHLPLDYLKIDGEFIHDLCHNPTNRIIVQAMVAAARPLGKQTIAEYVLDEKTADLLRELHVDHDQGFYVGAAQDPEGLFAQLDPPRARVVDLNAPGEVRLLRP